MSKYIVGVLGLGLAIVANAAEEQPVRATEKPLTKEQARFRALDADNDRRLSLAEFQVDAVSREEFTKLDRDADGYLSMAEFIARPIPPSRTSDER